jgi:regulator of protease activity HflC (stomatin/prohibitin superfamily)
MDGLAVMIALAIVVIVTVTKGVKTVPQGYKHIVQRLGKYHSTLTPGLNFIIPYIDEVAYKLTTKDIVMDIPSQEVITEDNAVIIANAVAYINIVSPEKAVYGVEDYAFAIQNLVQTALRSIVGEMALDSALSSRDQIKAKLKAAISDDIADWGITLKTVEIQDINPSITMQQAMEEQAAAERQRRAAVTKAEGEKQALPWFQSRWAAMNCQYCICLVKNTRMPYCNWLHPAMLKQWFYRQIYPKPCVVY